MDSELTTSPPRDRTAAVAQARERGLLWNIQKGRRAEVGSRCTEEGRPSGLKRLDVVGVLGGLALRTPKGTPHSPHPLACTCYTQEVSYKLDGSTHPQTIKCVSTLKVTFANFLLLFSRRKSLI